MLDQVQEIARVNEQIREKTKQLRQENKQRAVYMKKWRDRVEIENMMGRFAILYSAGCYERLMEFFADTEQIYFQRSDVGIYEGKAAIKGFFCSLKDQAIEGSFRMMNLTSPVIQIAETDGTAQGIWYNNGLEAIKDASNPDAQAVDMWINDKVAAEFLETGQGWRILRLTICEEMRGLYHTSWGEYSQKPQYPVFDTFPEPCRPATRHLPFRSERKSQRNLITPEPYVAYETLAEHF